MILRIILRKNRKKIEYAQVNQFIEYDNEFRSETSMSSVAPSHKYLLWGEYPQTIASPEALSEMSEVIDNNGYYVSSYDDARYERIDAKPYAFGENYKFSNNITIIEGTEYYFKVEPIKWIILEEVEGKALLLADVLLDNHKFNDIQEEISNTWEKSEIRRWLNNEFYNKAFNAMQLEAIDNTLVDNSLLTGYYINPERYTLLEQNDTYDKIFLLSYEESVNELYGFDSNPDKNIDLRCAITSDYSRAKGVFMDTSKTYGLGQWWLRSQGDLANTISVVCCSNVLCEGEYVDQESVGVRPSMRVHT